MVSRCLPHGPVPRPFQTSGQEGPLAVWLADSGVPPSTRPEPSQVLVSVCAVCVRVCVCVCARVSRVMGSLTHQESWGHLHIKSHGVTYTSRVMGSLTHQESWGHLHIRCLPGSSDDTFVCAVSWWCASAHVYVQACISWCIGVCRCALIWFEQAVIYCRLVPRLSQQYYMDVSSWMIQMESALVSRGKQKDSMKEEVSARASLLINVRMFSPLFGTAMACV